jgi:quinol monooxygenase YgiN
MFVEIQLKPGCQAEWLETGRAHAKYSLENEPGTLRFEIGLPVDKDGKPAADRVYVHELYQDAAALDVHRKSPSMVKILELNKRIVDSVKAMHFRQD